MTSARSAGDCRPLLDELLDRVASRFIRPEPRLRAQLFVRGILSGLARKNSWTLAEFAGESDPNGMQRLLTSARWDVDGVRDDVREWVVERLGDEEYAVLVPIEAGFPKKGNRSVGVHRQYNDVARRAENVQVGLFLAYASPRGWALVDRELYLPSSWTADPERCERLGVPAGVGFVPKPELARRMIERFLAGGRRRGGPPVRGGRPRVGAAVRGAPDPGWAAVGPVRVPDPGGYHDAHREPGDRDAVPDRGAVPRGEEPDGPGPVPGPPVRRLVPARHPLPAGRGLPCGHPRAGGLVAGITSGGGPREKTPAGDAGAGPALSRPAPSGKSRHWACRPR